MRIAIFIAAHEKYEALDTYKDMLTDEQMEEIEESENQNWFIVKDNGKVTIEKAE
jgi:hypothetical protein